MYRFELLIDTLLAYLPTDLPFFSILMEQPEGRYIILGVAIVLISLLAWLFLAVMQKMFTGDVRNVDVSETLSVESSEEPLQRLSVIPDEDSGFSFFKKTGTNTDLTSDSDSDSDVILAAIEQEMLAVRCLYKDGHLIKDVYVSETRRLYDRAVSLKGM